jgi:hypothetical protein
MKSRTIGSVFMTRLVSFRGQARKQAENAKGEILAIIKEDMRDEQAGVQAGDTVICRVEERESQLMIDGDPQFNEDGSPTLSGNKFIRNEVIAFGTAQEMATRFYADEILDAEAADIVEETIAAARVARKIPVAAVAKPAVNAEPAVAGA